jgi:hypothetical protein
MIDAGEPIMAAAAAAAAVRIATRWTANSGCLSDTLSTLKVVDIARPATASFAAETEKQTSRRTRRPVPHRGRSQTTRDRNRIALPSAGRRSSTADSSVEKPELHSAGDRALV